HFKERPNERTAAASVTRPGTADKKWPVQRDGDAVHGGAAREGESRIDKTLATGGTETQTNDGAQGQRRRLLRRLQGVQRPSEIRPQGLLHPDAPDDLHSPRHRRFYVFRRGQTNNDDVPVDMDSIPGRLHVHLLVDILLRVRETSGALQRHKSHSADSFDVLPDSLCVRSLLDRGCADRHRRHGPGHDGYFFPRCLHEVRFDETRWTDADSESSCYCRSAHHDHSPELHAHQGSASCHFHSGDPFTFDVSLLRRANDDGRKNDRVEPRRGGLRDDANLRRRSSTLQIHPAFGGKRQRV
ncbi:hypothetical protein TSAR_008319, partial [Trichomalopsis sarcophagae]